MKLLQRLVFASLIFILTSPSEAAFTNYPFGYAVVVTETNSGTTTLVLPTGSQVKVGEVPLAGNDGSQITSNISILAIKATNAPCNGCALFSIGGTNGSWAVPSGGGGGGSTNGLQWVSAPVSTNSTGNPGDIAFDGNYYYICVDTNLWRRTTLGAW